MTTPTGDQALIKRINTAIVLESILRGAPLSRAQISEQTGLNKATVSSLVQDLIDQSLVKEIGRGESSGGRKPVMLEFIATAGYAIGLDLGVNYIRGVVTNIRGEVVVERTSSLRHIEPDFVINSLCDMIDDLISAAPAQGPYGFVGIGIGVPGIVDDSGSILFAPHLQWRDIPLCRMISERYSIPVTIDNEANVGALGEQKYGAGHQISNLIYVSVGMGIGTGLILNRTLYKGTSGYSGEMGHLTVDAHGKPCNCGNRGCWEKYASEQSLLEDAEKLGFDSLESLIVAAEEGNNDVLALFAKIGEYLGVGITNIVNVFNPDAIVIGNRMSIARPWIEASLRQTVVQRALGFHLRKVQLLFAELGERSAMMGAAEMAISGFFTRLKSS
ncbi:MAG: ROK family transcriptional regulator [Candidatus Cohnella colombiensis]|uniref:ROK family transcriptional regulator n=1 Tax=Candidatus Cohnella colombiensis TaxID=3121368 RepID=A0AA95EV17_9BACL|nr:MAG: ROK family transcriptional regulator [Cohnella sp.]